MIYLLCYAPLILIGGFFVVIEIKRRSAGNTAGNAKAAAPAAAPETMKAVLLTKAQAATEKGRPKGTLRSGASVKYCWEL